MAKQYERIAEQLRERIRAGELKPGQRLPAETALAKEYKTSLPTMRDALALLLSEGLIDKKHGVGNFVRKPRKLVQRDNARHQWEKDRARVSREERQATGATEHDTGLTVSDLIFSATYSDVPANEDLAAQFGVPVGTLLLERVYRTNHREEDSPFNIARSYLVRDMVAANPDLLDQSKEPWPGGTQNQLHTVGIELDRIVERITARPPTVEESEELGLQGGVAVVVLRKTSIDTQGRVVEVSDVTLPGDRTELIFRTHLARW
ncbi:GntR family transcriptional regulator [Streptomyces sp. ISL-10]|uniref:GntR family transcriptional regulator n=1 Tax=Streptomyces sp. ISL-10 TaxID=2819172 RepID=UPI001BE7BD2E|nr:GntR family transcriptional regulator [Streptomyces sp. ISL-10]MBT2369491.1 GntR family transcriptional regulator [Streptomyces sp. ISL-10]